MKSSRNSCILVIILSSHTIIHLFFKAFKVKSLCMSPQLYLPHICNCLTLINGNQEIKMTMACKFSVLRVWCYTKVLKKMVEYNNSEVIQSRRIRTYSLLSKTKETTFTRSELKVGTRKVPQIQDQITLRVVRKQSEKVQRS